MPARATAAPVAPPASGAVPAAANPASLVANPSAAKPVAAYPTKAPAAPKRELYPSYYPYTSRVNEERDEDGATREKRSVLYWLTYFIKFVMPPRPSVRPPVRPSVHPASQPFGRRSVALSLCRAALKK